MSFDELESEEGSASALEAQVDASREMDYEDDDFEVS